MATPNFDKKVLATAKALLLEAEEQEAINPAQKPEALSETSDAQWNKWKDRTSEGRRFILGMIEYLETL